MTVALSTDVRRALELSATGLSTAEVAERLDVPVAHVRQSLDEAIYVLGASSRLEAIVTAYRRGLIDLPHRCDGAAGAAVETAGGRRPAQTTFETGSTAAS